ncbi:MAG TPA: TIGR00341 family protein [Candidatus Acidoferrum sp.]|nr:TIGR00341 family protein [Candidatus Acidoferrum sp.]
MKALAMNEEPNFTGEERRASARLRVAEDSSFDRAYVVMNVLATVVASYGLLEDSAAVVIGAMIIAMLLGPISGVGLALVDSDNRLLAKAFASLTGGVLLVLMTAFLVGLLNREIPATTEMMTRTAPNVFDLIIALGGGTAGAFAMIYKRLNAAFVGVAIATALVPPLSTCGILLARGALSLSGGAFLLALSNIVGIQIASSAVFFLAGFGKSARPRVAARGVLLQNALSLGTLLILGILLTVNLHTVVAKQLYENKVRSTLKDKLLRFPGAYLAEVRFSPTADGTLVRATVRGPEPFSSQQVATMESSLPTPPRNVRSVLLVRYVHTTVMSATGQLYSPENNEADKTRP